MKLLPVLDIESDPETLIITIDDDVEYPPGLIERLVTASRQHPDQAIGFTGWVFDPQTSATSIVHLNASTPGSTQLQAVHVLEGYRGVLYRRRFFERDIWDHQEALSEFRFHDDILLSGYLGSRGIGRLVRWYGADPQEEPYHWQLNGEHIGLHTTVGWLERGKSCVEYWLRRDAGVFGFVEPLGLSLVRTADRGAGDSD